MGQITQFPIETTVFDDSPYLRVENNLSDVADAATARDNLGIKDELTFFPSPSLTQDQSEEVDPAVPVTAADCVAHSTRRYQHVVFRADPGVTDSDGLTPYIFKQPFIFPDNAHVVVMPGARLVLAPAADPDDVAYDPATDEPFSYHGGLVLFGQAGFTVGAFAFDDQSLHGTGVWWPPGVCQEVDLSWWGAVGDRSADIQRAFQSAGNTLPDGGVLRLGAGDFVFGDGLVTIPAHVTVRGAGRDLTHLYVNCSEGEHRGFEIKRRDGAGFEDLTFHRGFSRVHRDDTMIKFNYGAHNFIRRCIFDGCIDGVRFSSCHHFLVEDVQFRDVSFGAALWKAETAYKVGDVVITTWQDGWEAGSYYGRSFVCVTAGVSGASEPPESGDSVRTDGTVTWHLAQSRAVKIYAASGQGVIRRIQIDGPFNDRGIEIEDGSNAVPWESETSYAEGDIVHNSERTLAFKCIVAGTSGASEPEWMSPDEYPPEDGSTCEECVKDGTAYWVAESDFGYCEDIVIGDVLATQNKAPFVCNNIKNVRFDGVTATDCGYYGGGGYVFELEDAHGVQIANVYATAPAAADGRNYEFLTCKDAPSSNLLVSSSHVINAKRGLRLKTGGCSNLVLSASVVFKRDPGDSSMERYDDTTVGGAGDLTGAPANGNPNPYGRDDSFDY